ncbi:hypothetical protein B0T10DRAFT_580225 [Thelonectria olida]|uniref:Uncharacterized protein n=1 Tax=Thelonectria olida TaxID=1576542 RepID=A0A9P8W0D0_9HYPO|nr:hypothetical protein B0T10DRAFT_580225 [Thelonectria olida]
MASPPQPNTSVPQAASIPKLRDRLPKLEPRRRRPPPSNPLPHNPMHIRLSECRKVMLRKLQRLETEPYGERHAALIDIYISWVRENVIRKICSELDRERKRQNPHSQPERIQRTGTLLEAPLDCDEDELDDDRVEVEDCWVDVKLEEKQGINDVWCVLVFRMICWLLLHDFHKMDVQIDKDGLFGSRLPVYIA